MLQNLEHFQAITESCQNSPVGKLLPNALYVHTCALQSLDPILQKYEIEARNVAKDIEGATLVKFNLDKPKISYLFYPDFDTDPHPAIQKTIVVDLKTLDVNHRDYHNTNNPPILHRKETFVTSDYPLYEQFSELTRFEVVLGLLDNSRFIGTRQEWEKRLNYYGIAFEGHRLICLLKKNPKKINIDRHKAAIVRTELSRPVRLGLEADLFTPETTFFDYGCGHGGDIKRIGDRGYSSAGWDPYYHADAPLISADIVNIGYVINVIENTAERRQALIKAWELAKRILFVSAQVLIDDRNRGMVVYGDGIITSRNTFQKYYEQEELKIYIDQVLNVDCIPAGLGIYFVFRDESEAQAFRVSRFHSQAKTPKVYKEVRQFEDYENMLEPLMEFITKRGRLPVKEELENESELKAEFGNYRRAFQLILQVTDEEKWEMITEKRRQDLLLYLALSKFSDRPSSRKLSPEVREDIKALFGSYQKACLLADMMLFSLSDLENIADLCNTSPVGKKLRNSLLVHVSALESLEPVLRLYEGCASRTIGRSEDANLIKFHTNKPKISYLYYPNFNTDAHPLLRTSMQVELQDLHVSYRDYDPEDNPPILQEKDAVVTPDYPLYEKFAKLTRQEKGRGLLDDFGAISRLQGWLECLEEHCVTIKGHQLYWRKDADAYKVKLLKAQIRSRQNKRRKQKKDEV